MYRRAPFLRPTKSQGFLESLSHALHGLFIAILIEANVRRHFVVLTIVILLAWWLQLRLLELIMLSGLAVLVLITELLNSALEAFADAVHPDYSEYIQRAKDMAAAAVLLMSVFAAVVGLLIFMPHLNNFFATLTHLVGT